VVCRDAFSGSIADWGVYLSEGAPAEWRGVPRSATLTGRPLGEGGFLKKLAARKRGPKGARKGRGIIKYGVPGITHRNYPLTTTGRSRGSSWAKRAWRP